MDVHIAGGDVYTTKVDVPTMKLDVHTVEVGVRRGMLHCMYSFEGLHFVSFARSLKGVKGQPANVPMKL